jgi:Replication-relaxation
VLEASNLWRRSGLDLDRRVHPKVYFLRNRGFAYLSQATDMSGEEVKTFRETHKELAWTPAMYHRIRLVDCLLALERALLLCPQLQLRKTLLEYRRVRGTKDRETTDYVAEPFTSENRIVPDGAFILENREKGRTGLFFVEMDMGTERVIAPASRDQRATIRGKFAQYDRYLSSGRFVKTYSPYGGFSFFVLLFVPLSGERIDNIRAAVSDLTQNLHAYYYLTTLVQAEEDFLGPIWKSWDQKDTVLHALVSDA